MSMSITHTVLLQFKENTEAKEIEAACRGFLSLKDGCLHPNSKVPYIVSLKGGKDNSPEGLQNGITHGFVVEFASATDRNYYLERDPVHLAYAASLRLVAAKVIVVDFVNGQY